MPHTHTHHPHPSYHCLPLLQLSIDINGEPMGGSPFPVFFSAPDPSALILAAAAPQPTAPAPADAAPADAAATAAPAASAAPGAAAMPPASMGMPGLNPALAAAFPNLGGPALNLPLVGAEKFGNGGTGWVQVVG